MFATILLYSLIYITLHSRIRPESMGSSKSVAPLAWEGADRATILRTARYMIIYPTIYVLCTLPLAGGRMAAMNGHMIPYWYYCFAGAAITSCGWLDVLLYACTRRVLVFSNAPPPINQFGLETFGVWNRPEELWSVRTVVEGGVLADPTKSTRRRHVRNNSSCRPSSYDVSSHGEDMDDTFDVAVPDVITTKRTIYVTTEPGTIIGGARAFKAADRHEEEQMRVSSNTDTLFNWSIFRKAERREDLANHSEVIASFKVYHKDSDNEL
jgi:hypothetical protein